MYRDIDDKQKMKVLQRMIRAESQHKVYNKIQYLRNRDQATHGLVNLKVPREADITDNEQLKTPPRHTGNIGKLSMHSTRNLKGLLLLRNKHHFQSSRGHTIHPSTP